MSTLLTKSEGALRHRYFFGLDLIRFAAASMVMLFHLGYWSWAEPTLTTAAAVQHRVYLPAMTAFRAGWAGVEIFFLISGFVIAASAVGASAASFARSRFLRLAPTIWIISAVALGCVWWVHTRAGEPLLLEYLKANVLVFSPPWLDGVYWTLGIEISFYICVFFLLLARPAMAAERSLRDLAICLVALSSTYWVLALLDLASDRWMMKVLLLEHGCQFGAGIGIWLTTRKPQRLAGAIVVALSIPACILQIHGASVGLSRGSSSFHPALALWACGLLTILLSAHISFELKGLGARVGRNLGLATYPLYLIHNCIGGTFLGVVVGVLGNNYTSLTLSFAFSIGLALLVSIYAEPRLRRRVGAVLGEQAHQTRQDTVSAAP